MAETTCTSLGFCSATLTVLSNASNFDITHSFVLQAYEAINREMLEVFLPTISCNPSLAPLVDKFSDEVVSAFRQGNIPDGRTETIVDMSECTEQLRDAFTSFVYTKQHPQMIRGCFGVGSYLKMR